MFFPVFTSSAVNSTILCENWFFYTNFHSKHTAKSRHFYHHTNCFFLCCFFLARYGDQHRFFSSFCVVARWFSVCRIEKKFSINSKEKKLIHDTNLGWQMNRWLMCVFTAANLALNFNRQIGDFFVHSFQFLMPVSCL